MSAESGLDEDIEEQLEDYTDDDELQKDVDILADIASDVDCEHDTNEAPNEINTNIRTTDATETIKIATGAADTFIEKFSSELADNLVKEALVINEIYDRDKLNSRDFNNVNVTGADGINVDDDILNTEDSAISKSYDRYLLEKLLHSEADPSEITECSGFDGKEENFIRDTDQEYPGPDSDVTCLKDGMGQSETEPGDSGDNDQNNNQLLSSLGDSALQTIHEDAELEIDNPRHNKQVEVGDAEVTIEEDKTITEPAVGTETVQTESTTEEVVAEEVSAKPNKRHAIRCDGDDRTDDEDDDDNEKADYKSDSSSDESEDTDIDDYCCEMTPRQKWRIVRAVRDGNIDKLEDLLEKKNADMDMHWYGETLLMVAIRAEQEEMAEFLIDNGIDLDHLAKLVERNEKGDIKMFSVNARQMAFDKNMDNIVELLDTHSNNIFPFIQPREREVRMRRPPPPTPPPPPETDSEDDFSYDGEEDICKLDLNGGNASDTKAKRRKSIRDPDDLRRQSVQTAEYTSEGNERGEKLERFKSATDTEFTDKTDITERESVHTAASKQECSDSNHSKAESNDELSRVFGQDEGYETMSPVSPPVLQNVPKLEHNVVGTKEHVNVRGTKASHVSKAHKCGFKHSNSSSVDSVHDNSVYHVKTVGSYNFESRRWHQSKSAPAPKNFSIESIPDTIVRLGIPFVHGEEKLKPLSAGSRQHAMGGRSYSARSLPSPFSEVTQVLAGSKLLNTTNGPRTSTPNFPSIHKKHSNTYRNNDYPTRTRINYIYANRKSPNPHERITFCDVSSPRSKPTVDLLPKRKLKQ